jgi:hypothetical protein
LEKVNVTCKNVFTKCVRSKLGKLFLPCYLIKFILVATVFSANYGNLELYCDPFETD